MTASFLVDSNVLVYFYDRREPDKQKQAGALLQDLHREGLGAISTQVLAEFVVSVMRKIPDPLTHQEAQERVATYCAEWVVLAVTPATVLEAVRGMQAHRMSYWATAKLAGLPAVLSEDFNTGATIEGVTFANPFAPGFRLRDWLR